MTTLHRGNAIVLVIAFGIVAFIAQVAGVGTTSRGDTKPSARVTSIATLPGAAVPDIASTRLGTVSSRAAEGDTLRMRGTATLTATKVRGGAVQVVCGLRYRRDGDRGWSLGTPYETVTLPRRNAGERVRIERTFTAPATDRYRASIACHVVAPAKGASVTASGAMRVDRGLPSGAAIPVE